MRLILCGICVRLRIHMVEVRDCMYGHTGVVNLGTVVSKLNF